MSDYTTSALPRENTSSLEINFPAIPETPKHIRKQLKIAIENDWELPFSIDAEQFLLAVGEAATNAVKHGSSSPKDVIRLRASFDFHTRCLTVEISDYGPGFDVEAVPIPTKSEFLLAESGRGVFMMRGLCDELEYSRSDCGTWHICTMVKKL